MSNIQLYQSTGYEKGQFGRLSPKIWTCGKSAQKWCQNCWMMIRRSIDYRYYLDLPLMMRHGFLNTTRKSRTRAISGSHRRYRSWRKQKSHVDHILQCERSFLRGVLATGPDDQLSILQGDLATYSSFRARKEARAVAGQIVAASPRQCTCSQRLEHHPGTGWGEISPHCNNYPIHQNLLRVTFFLSTKLKGIIKGARFDGMEVVKKVLTKEQRGIPEKSFPQCIETWLRRIRKYIWL